MIVLITGASHTGKTLLAQKFLEKYKYPYFSIDLLKMGLIWNKNTALTPEDGKELEDNTYYLNMCEKYNCNYILIDDCYQVEANL